MMNENYIDFEEVEFADEMIRAIEKDYGRSVARIPYFERVGRHSFDIKIIFTDFRLLEGEIKVVPSFPLISVQIHGTYY
jgi:hypothetical protein